MNNVQQRDPGSEFDFLRSFPLVRAVVVGVLILVLQIPIVAVWGLIGERQSRYQEALSEVGEKWGGRQIVGGPVWVVPYRKNWTQQTADGQLLPRSGVFAAVFLPERLEASAAVTCQHRYRGIFKIPVFEMTLDLDGEFGRPDLSELGIEAADVLWERAVLSLWISDPHSIREETVLRWDGAERVFQPGSSEWLASPGIQAPLPLPLEAERFPFSVRLRLDGTEGMFLGPVGRTTKLLMRANWPDPSFQGRWLPSSHSVTDEGFEAEWQVPAIGRNFPQAWAGDSENLEGEIRDSAFGVKFISPIDPYRMAQRSLKYEFLFLLLPFMVMGLIEALSGFRFHWLQYALIGAALCLFYLLELSLSEHLGFLPAYLLAVFGIVALIAAYCYWITGSPARSLAVTAVVAGLYGYLYILLLNQDYALLVGSLGLFAALAAVMYLTRRIDWSRI